MTIDDTQSLVAVDESRTLELKKTTGELKDGMHSACAFLNTDGGWLIFGVTPKCNTPGDEMRPFKEERSLLAAISIKN